MPMPKPMRFELGVFLSRLPPWHVDVGVEGHASCYLMVTNSTGGGVDIQNAQADCVARGGHLLTTAAVALQQGSLLDAVLDANYGSVFYIGAYRCGGNRLVKLPACVRAGV